MIIFKKATHKYDRINSTSNGKFHLLRFRICTQMEEYVLFPDSRFRQMVENYMLSFLDQKSYRCGILAVWGVVGLNG
jgi:hypothetical protein